MPILNNVTTPRMVDVAALKVAGVAHEVVQMTNGQCNECGQRVIVCFSKKPHGHIWIFLDPNFGVHGYKTEQYQECSKKTLRRA